MRRRRLGLALAAVLVWGLAAAAASDAAYRAIDRWGRIGNGPGEFGSGVLGGGANRQYDNPGGIALAADGTVYVVDVSNNRVQRFSRTGAFRGSFGRRGRDNGSIRRVIMRDRFYQPEAVAIGANGLAYVVDTGNDRIMVWNQQGRFVRQIGHHGSKRGEWVQPWAAATAGSAFWVVDQGNYRIQRWSLTGRYLGAFGTFGRRAGQFVTPYGIAVTPGGELVYVADAIRRKVIVFTGTGRFVREFGVAGTRAGQFRKPTGVAVGPDRSVFVADRCNHRIERFDANGVHLESIADPGLVTPTFLAADAGGNLFVADHHRVLVLAPTNALAARGRAADHFDDPDVACNRVR